MKKIAVLRCLRTSNNCTGSGCGDVQMPNNEEGLRKKLDRLVTIGVEAVHLSGCTKKKDAQGEKHECPVITKTAEYLEQQGITVVRGTPH